jgi:hypothetical protein
MASTALTLRDGQIVQLRAPHRPGWFKALIRADYASKPLPLWRFQLQPSHSDAREVKHDLPGRARSRRARRARALCRAGPRRRARVLPLFSCDPTTAPSATARPFASTRGLPVSPRTTSWRISSRLTKQAPGSCFDRICSLQRSRSRVQASAWSDYARTLGDRWLDRMPSAASRPPFPTPRLRNLTARNWSC